MVGKPTGHFQSAFVGISACKHDSEGLPPGRFWAGHFRDNGMPHTRNVQLGPLSTDGMQDFVSPAINLPR